MIKVFTTNKNGKIEMTKDELKKLLDEAYWEGYSANFNRYVYTSPSVWTPYSWTTCNGSVTLNSTCATGSDSIHTVTISSNDITSGASINSCMNDSEAKA